MSTDQGVIPDNADFPVRWQQPGDDALQWRFFVQSFPNQVAPLDFDVLVQRIMRGADHAFASLKQSFQDTLSRRINTYVYRAVAPLRDDGAGESDESSVAAALQALRDSIDDLARAWDEEHLPQLRAFLDEFSPVDLTALSAPELVAHFDHASDRLARLWELHFLILFPAAAAVNEFDRTYRELFGSDNALDPYRLLGGTPNKTVEAGKALWQLSRRAEAVPAVRKALAETPAEKVVALLDTTVDGRAFLGELDHFLNEYGQRGDMCSLTAESWLENPVTVIRNLASYLNRPDSAAPEHTQRRAAQERDEALTDIRHRLAGYPRQVAALFEQLLAAAQVGSMLTEEHTFYIDYGGVYQVRRIILEMGRRLVDGGLLGRVEEVFLLGSDDLRRAVTDPHDVDVTAIVQANDAEMRRFSTVTPAPVIGSAVPPQLSPSYLAFMRNLAGMAAPPGMGAPAEPGTLRGTPGAVGVARGIARIVHTLNDAERLGPGEILVAPTTAPPWTPLFAVAAGIVTDTGGVLSHCAVVAREYGVPTVVGAMGATTTITDGQLVEVDGTTGVVRLLEEQ